MLYASCAIWNTIGYDFVNIFIVLQDWWKMCGLKLGGLSINCKQWYLIIITQAIVSTGTL